LAQALPKNLQTLILDCIFDRSKATLRFPMSLQNLSLMGTFTESLSEAALPRALQKLTPTFNLAHADPWDGTRAAYAQRTQPQQLERLTLELNFIGSGCRTKPLLEEQAPLALLHQSKLLRAKEILGASLGPPSSTDPLDSIFGSLNL